MSKRKFIDFDTKETDTRTLKRIKKLKAKDFLSNRKAINNNVLNDCESKLDIPDNDDINHYRGYDY